MKRTGFRKFFTSRQRVASLLGLLYLVSPCLRSGTLFGQEAAAPAGGLEIASFEGTLTAIAGDKIKVKGKDGAERMAVVNAQSTLKYTGTADVKFLRPGLTVRFSAVFDVRKGIPLAPLNEIEIFRPAKERRMSPEQRQSQTPGIYPVNEKKDSNVQSPKDGQQNFLVVGLLRAVQSNKIQVFAGSRPIMADLNEQIKISVVAGDVLFCQPGDKVKVTGLRNPSQQDWVQAETVEIVGSKPLGAMAAEQATQLGRGASSQRSERSKPGGENKKQPN